MNSYIQLARDINNCPKISTSEKLQNKIGLYSSENWRCRRRSKAEILPISAKRVVQRSAVRSALTQQQLSLSGVHVSYRSGQVRIVGRSLFMLQFCLLLVFVIAFLFIVMK